MSTVQTVPTPRAVDRVDAIASAWVAQAAPVRFGIAGTPDQIEAVYRLRCEVVLAKRWAPPDAFPGGLEHDADDARAVQVAGWDRAGVAAAGRLVLPAPGRRLPTEEAFDIVVPGLDRSVDVGRVCVASAYRDVAHRVFFGLLGHIWLEMRRHGYEEACAVVNAGMARMYERWGLHVALLGSPRRYWGERRYPARIVPSPAVDRLTRTVGGTPEADR